MVFHLALSGEKDETVSTGYIDVYAEVRNNMTKDGKVHIELNQQLYPVYRKIKNYFSPFFCKN
jgi:hypothetical protein